MSTENVGENLGNNVSDELEVKPYDIRVSIASDYLTASLTIEFNTEGARISKEAIMDAIKEKNITFGIHTHLIDEIVNKSENIYDVEIAKGIAIQNGQNGKVTYNFDATMTKKPTINEDGSVDFKNIHFLIPTKKGDILATRTMPTEGRDGTLVTGKIMKARDGKMVNFKIGKNVEISEDGLSAVSACDGSIKFDGDKVSVMQSLEIPGDVGIETGNIEFAGKVIINGNVTSGYQVVATDDIIVYGVVEAATIKTTKNLTINRGVQGNDQAVLRAGGDIVAKFINGANVECKGNIMVDSIMHSDIHCESELKAEGKNGLIIGGNVYAKTEIQAKCIGSKMGTITFVSVGVLPEVIKEYKDLEEKRNEVFKNLQKVEKVIELIEKQENISEENQAVCKRSKALRNDYQAEIKQIQSEMSVAGAIIKNIGKSVIKAKDIYPGVRLKVDNNYYSIKERVLSVKFKKEKAEVVMSPWEG